jgi:hypothetical protein
VTRPCGISCSWAGRASRTQAATAGAAAARPSMRAVSMPGSRPAPPSEANGAFVHTHSFRVLSPGSDCYLVTLLLTWFGSPDAGFDSCCSLTGASPPFVDSQRSSEILDLEVHDTPTGSGRMPTAEIATSGMPGHALMVTCCGREDEGPGRHFTGTVPALPIVARDGWLR